MELLAQQGEDHWLPWQQKRPLLHIACERGAWNCVKYLVSERSDEINQCYDEYYPIHHAALLDIKFLELLIQCGAETTVKTSTQLMTALHVVLLQVNIYGSKVGNRERGSLREGSVEGRALRGDCARSDFFNLFYLFFLGGGRENCGA